MILPVTPKDQVSVVQIIQCSKSRKVQGRNYKSVQGDEKRVIRWLSTSNILYLLPNINDIVHLLLFDHKHIVSIVRLKLCQHTPHSKHGFRHPFRCRQRRQSVVDWNLLLPHHITLEKAWAELILSMHHCTKGCGHRVTRLNKHDILLHYLAV